MCSVLPLLGRVCFSFLLLGVFFISWSWGCHLFLRSVVRRWLPWRHGHGDTCGDRRRNGCAHTPHRIPRMDGRRFTVSLVFSSSSPTTLKAISFGASSHSPTDITPSSQPDVNSAASMLEHQALAGGRVQLKYHLNLVGAHGPTTRNSGCNGEADREQRAVVLAVAFHGSPIQVLGMFCCSWGALVLTCQVLLLLSWRAVVARGGSERLASPDTCKARVNVDPQVPTREGGFASLSTTHACSTRHDTIEGAGALQLDGLWWTTMLNPCRKAPRNKARC